MPAFRVLNQFPVYLGRDNQPADNGWLAFYESGTTTPKSVYADPGLTIDNGATVTIGSDGRTEVDIWGDGSYRVRLYEADGTLLAEVDNVEVAGGDAQTIPALVDGWFLTNNGALLLWEDIRNLLLPDPTGQDGKQLVADGDSALWQAIPEPPDPPEPDIEVTEAAGVLASFLAGVASDPAKFAIETGTGTAPATNANSTTASVTFANTFDASPFVLPIATGVANGSGWQAHPAIQSKSATGATFRFTTSAGNDSTGRVTQSIPFDWIALGIRTP